MRSREEERAERREAFGDAVYDAWRQGLNSDAVSEERVDDYYCDLGDRHLAAEAEVAYLARRAAAARKETP